MELKLTDEQKERLKAMAAQLAICTARIAEPPTEKDVVYNAIAVYELLLNRRFMTGTLSLSTGERLQLWEEKE